MTIIKLLFVNKLSKRYRFSCSSFVLRMNIKHFTSTTCIFLMYFFVMLAWERIQWVKTIFRWKKNWKLKRESFILSIYVQRSWSKNIVFPVRLDWMSFPLHLSLPLSCFPIYFYAMFTPSNVKELSQKHSGDTALCFRYKKSCAMFDISRKSCSASLLCWWKTSRSCLFLSFRWKGR